MIKAILKRKEDYERLLDKIASIGERDIEEELTGRDLELISYALEDVVKAIEKTLKLS